MRQVQRTTRIHITQFKRSVGSLTQKLKIILSILPLNALRALDLYVQVDIIDYVANNS